MQRAQGQPALRHMRVDIGQTEGKPSKFRALGLSQNPAQIPQGLFPVVNRRLGKGQ